ncbi:unnamed protein product [Mycena citricolor]|uniref:Uncharacterized protein n=1 Tax=Mycena citricolor TaxID=2018698 RepID=A0AAD2K6T9_9AGAR|nr:unnamed protein product [Mycena citricolor]
MLAPIWAKTCARSESHEKKSDSSMGELSNVLGRKYGSKHVTVSFSSSFLATNKNASSIFLGLALKAK